jgi:nucleoid-associated protein YgaU
MNKRVRNTSTIVSSLLALAALVVLVPALLLAASRARFGSSNPLSGVSPPWRWTADDVRDAVSEPLRDDAVVDLIVRGALTVVWVAVAVVTITTIIEVVHMARHRGMPTPRVRGVGWAQSIARFIAIGLVAVLPTSGFATAAEAPGHTAGATLLERTLTAPSDPTTVASAPDAAPRAAFDLRSRSVSTTPFTGAVDETGRSSDRGDDDDRPPIGSGEATRSTHVVERGESVWEIAEQFGDGTEASTMEIAEAILDANLGTLMADGHRFTNPALIRTGWVLQIPTAVASATPAVDPVDETIHADAVVERTDATDPAESADASPLPPENAPDSYVVVEGDTLSSVADELLGDDDEWPLLFDANDGTTMADGRVFDDPNLLLPGWELDVPMADGDRPGDEIDADAAVNDGTELVPDSLPDDGDAASDDELDDVDIVTDSEREAPPSTENTTTVDEAGTPDDTAPPTDAATPADTTTPHDATTTPVGEHTVPDTTSATAPASSTTTTTTPPASTDSAGGAADQRRPEPSPQAPSPIRLEHGALLAAGILALVGVRRARVLRAATPRARVPVPPPDVTATERKLRTIEPGEGAARLDIALRAAAHELAETGAQIGVVRLSPDGHIALRLTRPGRLDAPWVGMGQDWELPAAIPIELLAEAARRAGTPCVALAQIGVDALGRSVLLDLEAAGITAIEARRDQADEVIRAVAMAVASSLHSEVAHLVTVSVNTECLLDHQNAHRRQSVRAAIDLALALTGSTATNERSTFDLRALRTSGEAWEPAVVFLDTDDDAFARLDSEALPQPGHGLAITCAAPHGADGRAGARIVAHADRWELHAFDELSEIAPIGLTTEGLDDVTALLADAAAPTQLPEPAFTEAADPVDEPFEAVPHDIVVGLMGGVEIRSANGELGVFERSKTVELIAWLATHRDRATRSAARTALWELDVRDATFANVVSEARRALGRLVPTPDGEEWLARTLNESLPLHPRVVTDADLVEQRLEHARLSAPAHAIDVLRPAVEMIRDMPFAGTSYLWPDADGITSNLVLLATTVTAELAAHALSIGDTETVFWATGHGLRVLPGHEELIALRMRARARTGDLAGVRQEWESYERVIVADAWSDGEPAPKLLELRRELLAPKP